MNSMCILCELVIEVRILLTLIRYVDTFGEGIIPRENRCRLIDRRSESDIATSISDVIPITS